jgi:V/A-type H+-transporting ATPase subunit A
MKYSIPNEDIDKIEELKNMINDFYNKLELDYSK